MTVPTISRIWIIAGCCRFYIGISYRFFPVNRNTKSTLFYIQLFLVFI
nr:MAG TPA: hypothetical protein [Caudoviricetes sp.]